MKVLRKKKFVLFEYFQRTFPMIGILSMFPASLARRVLDAPGIFGRQSSSSCYELRRALVLVEFGFTYSGLVRQLPVFSRLNFGETTNPDQ